MASPSILLITPPMVQVNTPYPAMPWLAGFLKSQGYLPIQADLSLALFHRLFSRRGLIALQRHLQQKTPPRSPSARHFLRNANRYISAIEPIKRFLQGRDESMARLIVSRRFLPEGPRFDLLRNYPFLEERFGEGTFLERARYLASLFIDDLTDAIREGADHRFALARWAEDLAVLAPSFDPIRDELTSSNTWMDRELDRLAQETLSSFRPALVALTIPFPGALYGALRIARQIRRCSSSTRIAIGGAFVSTELRSLADPRLFDDVDAVVLDDGEHPLLRLVEWAVHGRSDRLIRTFLRVRGEVVMQDHPPPGSRPPPLGSFLPAYEDLHLDDYLPLSESAVPIQNLWNDTRWIKLPTSRGCSWRRCRFCDLSLPAIARYETTPPDRLAARMAELMARTGRCGFHFTDEALPPDYLDALAQMLERRKIHAVWWGNIRFERGFSKALVERLAHAGCVAVTGGLETVHDRTLRLLRKGITVQEALRTCARFAQAGVTVHAYLMYEAPTQTIAETLDALEIVRQAFAAGILHSAYWHRFALSAHSPLARHPERVGLRLLPCPFQGFARNTLPHEEPGAEAGRAALATGLHKAVFNFQHGVGLKRPISIWFDHRVPRPRVPSDFVIRCTTT